MKPSLMVPLDGSPFAERAVPLATAIARRTGSSLYFVGVHVDTLDADWPAAAPIGRVDAVRRGLESTQLEELARRGDLRADVEARAVLLDGPVPLVLTLAAREAGSWCIVMMGHRRPPWGRILHGSVADALVRRAGVPVLLGAPRSPGAPAPGRFERVLVVADGSPDMERVVAAALDVAGAEPEYVLVTPRHASAASAGSAGGTDDEAHRTLDSARRRLVERGGRVRVLASPRQGSGIAAAARSGDLIAIGTDRRRRPMRLIRTRTLDAVLHAAPDVPVLVVGPSRADRPADAGLQSVA